MRVLRGILHLIWRILVGQQAMWGGVLNEWGASGDTIAEKNLQSLCKDEKVLYDMQVHENPEAHCTTRPPHLTASAWAWAGSHVLFFFQCVSDNESLVFRKAFKLDAVLKRLSRIENVWLWNAVLCQFEERALYIMSCKYGHKSIRLPFLALQISENINRNVTNIRYFLLFQTIVSLGNKDCYWKSALNFFQSKTPAGIHVENRRLYHILTLIAAGNERQPQCCCMFSETSIRWLWLCSFHSCQVLIV